MSWQVEAMTNTLLTNKHAAREANLYITTWYFILSTLVCSFHATPSAFRFAFAVKGTWNGSARSQDHDGIVSGP